MHILEELLVSKDHTSQIIKGKRTKRQRLPSPITTNTIQLRDRTEEEEEDEDMANCLILLAQGNHHHNHHNTSNKSSLYLNYQCKTCNRCFPSFQALGGHRTSHKKPKPTGSNHHHGAEDQKQGVVITSNFLNELEDGHDPTTNTILSLQIVPNKGSSTKDHKPRKKVSDMCRTSVDRHECSVCGAEFSSGQALGGHMRRHRALNLTSGGNIGGGGAESEEVKKSRSVLKLDLNLPATEDDHQCRDTEFSFQHREKVVVFSGSCLVDCHY